MKESTQQLIQQSLQDAFSPSTLEIQDESHLHAGHAGAQAGKGHYALTIASQAFAGKSAVQRHKMIYTALGSLMDTHIHALSIKIV